ncbi:MAG: hypothetical protein K5739_07165 [Lachnospiraceae bacterium]|nr:hypothetical protein [Lachnospiraceae bacterium]
MSRAIYKAPFVSLEEEQRLIDADQLYTEKVGQLPEDFGPGNDPVARYGFDPYGDGESAASDPAGEEDPALSALFGDSAPENEMTDPGNLSPEDFLQDENGGSGPEDGFSAGIPAQAVDEATMGGAFLDPGELQLANEQASEQAREILEQAQQQAQGILEEAEKEARELSHQIFDEAKNEGYETGYREGTQRAEQEGAALKAELDRTKRDLVSEYDEKIRMMEPALVEELTGIYEHIFTVDLSNYRNVIRHLITNTLHAVESSSTYLVHVSSQDYSALSMQKSMLREEGNLPDSATFELVEDISLGKNECLIETDDGIFDCSLTVQLDELKRKLKLLSYEGTRR